MKLDTVSIFTLLAPLRRLLKSIAFGLSNIKFVIITIFLGNGAV